VKEKSLGAFDYLVVAFLDFEEYKDERGFEQIAAELGIEYPAR